MTTMTNQPLVSIIVPVYRAEKYIYQCVESILAQTYSNIEVILVDDGSPDRCGEICDEYAAQDCRVKVIHQQNGGVSVARQTGIEHATGVYSIHADPDDWVENTMIEELVAKALETNADYTFCNYYAEYADGHTEYINTYRGEELTSHHLLELTIADMRNVSLWLALVKVSFVEGIKFVPIMNWREDHLFLIKLLNRNAKIAYLPKGFYHYRVENLTSLTHSLSETHIWSCIDYANAVNNEIKDRQDLGNYYVLSFKRNALKYLIRSGSKKFFKYTKSLFPEIHAIVIDEGKFYNWNNPEKSCLSIALRGKPNLAYYLYKSNLCLFYVKGIIKNILMNMFNNKKCR